MFVNVEMRKKGLVAQDTVVRLKIPKCCLLKRPVA